MSDKIDPYLEFKIDHRCNCDLCLLSRRIQKVFPDMSQDQRETIDDLWCRMECAETDLCILKYGWPKDSEDELNEFVCQILSEL